MRQPRDARRRIATTSSYPYGRAGREARGREVWKAYLGLRSHLVRTYFGLRLVVLAAVLVATLYAAFGVWRLLTGEAARTWSYAITLMVSALLVFGSTFLLGVLLAPVAALLYRDLSGWSYIERCDAFIEDDPDTYDEETLELIGAFAGTNSGVEWGLVAVLGILFAVALALLTPNVLEQLPLEWRILSWAFAAVALFGCTLSALLANADAAIKHTVAMRRSILPSVRPDPGPKSPWLPH